MPSKEKHRNHHNFNSCIRRLSEAINLKQSEKLSDFIRRAVKWLLKEAPAISKKPKKIAPDNGITFDLHPGSLLISEFELDFYSKADRRKGIPMATIKCRDNYYKGLPDGHPKIERIEDLPPLVRRRLIYADSVRNGSHSEWSQIRHNGNGNLKLDFQLRGAQKRKKKRPSLKLLEFDQDLGDTSALTD